MRMLKAKTGDFGWSDGLLGAALLALLLLPACSGCEGGKAIYTHVDGDWDPIINDPESDLDEADGLVEGEVDVHEDEGLPGEWDSETEDGDGPPESEIDQDVVEQEAIDYDADLPDKCQVGELLCRDLTIYRCTSTNIWRFEMDCGATFSGYTGVTCENGACRVAARRVRRVLSPTRFAVATAKPSRCVAARSRARSPVGCLNETCTSSQYCPDGGLPEPQLLARREALPHCK